MAQFSKIKDPLRMPEVIVRQIENQIYSGELLPDHKLPSENELMKQFGVSRNTIREALRILESSGLIKVKQGAHGGSIITRMSNQFVSDFLVKAIRLSEISWESVADYRLALEPSVAEMAAAKLDINPVIIQKMERNLAKVQKIYAAKEITEYPHMDFHGLIAMATENPLFIVAARTIRAAFNLTNHPRNRYQLETIDFHEAILAAIKAHDRVTARDKMREHLLQLRDLQEDETFY